MKLLNELIKAKSEVYEIERKIRHYFKYTGENEDFEYIELSRNDWRLKDDNNIIEIIPTKGVFNRNTGEYECASVFRGLEYTLIMIAGNGSLDEDDPIIFKNSNEVKNEPTR